jgi:nucleoid-associated protein YgaU
MDEELVAAEQREREAEERAAAAARAQRMAAAELAAARAAKEAAVAAAAAQAAAAEAATLRAGAVGGLDGERLRRAEDRGRGGRGRDRDLHLRYGTDERAGITGRHVDAERIRHDAGGFDPLCGPDTDELDGLDPDLRAAREARNRGADRRRLDGGGLWGAGNRDADADGFDGALGGRGLGGTPGGRD